MEWMTTLNKSIDYMERHLLDNITVEDVAKYIAVSSFYYQKGFKILTGYSVSEYLRNRRLYLAGLELANDNEKVIDVALKYGYETPESFTKAFSRFHGISPQQARTQSYKLQSFHALTIKIILEGGNKMDYRIEKKEAFKVFGLKKEFTYETAYEQIPKFWDEFCAKYCTGDKQDLYGMFGVCMEESSQSQEFTYYIADTYDGGELRTGCETVEIPAYTWAIFTCKGPLPGALQTVNTKIFSEWLPGNELYEIAGGINIEMYTQGDTKSADYISEIWVPVKTK